jgi:hypothetical protein
MKKWIALLAFGAAVAGCSDASQPLASTPAGPKLAAWGVDNDYDGIDDGTEAELADRFAPLLYMPNLISRAEAEYTWGDWTWPANVEWYLANTQMRFHHDNCPDHQILNLGTINTSNLITQVHQRATSWLGCSHSGTTYGSGAASGYDNGYNGENHFFLQAVYDDVTHPGVRDASGWKVYTHVYRNTIGGVSIQYWFFYPYNDFIGGFNHESDWEHITVKLDPAQQVAGLIYAAHFTPKVLRSDEVTWYGTHPEVWVADGSHASYATEGQCDADYPEGPNNDSCWTNLDQRWFTWSGGKGADQGLQGGGLVNMGEMPQDGANKRPMPGQGWILFSGHWGEEGTSDLTSGQPGPGQHREDWTVDMGTGCGEASCTPVQAAYISHFTGPDCTGTESYYTPYFNYDGVRRSWNGTGMAGTTLRTVTNRSYKNSSGTCSNAWPNGNTLSGFVTIYR